jgi:hypothetical protein
MSIAEIRKLSMREKFQIMEALWEDMRPEIDQADIPDEHKRILDECHARVAAGEEKFLDLSTAKQQIGIKW